MKESKFQRDLKKHIRLGLPGAFVLKQTGSGIPQGFPDLIILHGNKWAALEVKESADAPHRPNQDIYVSGLNEMSYASFIYPENEKEVLNEVFEALKP